MGTIVPICIHVYTAGYIYTHAHNRALYIRAHMSTTGLLYIYMHVYVCTQHYLCMWVHVQNMVYRSKHMYT